MYNFIITELVSAKNRKKEIWKMTKFKKFAAAGLTMAMTAAMSVVAFASTDITVHFKNTCKWDNVGVWAYEGMSFTTQVMPADLCPAYNTKTDRAIWPGAKMTAEQDYDGWYSIKLSFEDTSSGAALIFNNLVADTKADTTTGGDPTDQEFLDGAKAKGLICDTDLKKQTPNRLIAKNFTSGEYWCDFDGNISGSTALLSNTKPASYVKKVSTKISNIEASGLTDKSISLKWDKFKGADSYKVLVKDSKTKKFKSAVNAKKNKATVKKALGANVKTGKTYTFKVVAYKGGKQIAESTTINAIALKVPTISKVAKSGKTVKVTIKKTSGVSGYVVYRAEKKNGEYVAVGSTTKTSFVDKTVVKGKTYYYKVSAYKKNGKTNLSGGISTKPVSIKVK